MKKIVVLLIAILFPCSLLAYGDYQTLEIIAPKASGSVIESSSALIPTNETCTAGVVEFTFAGTADISSGTSYGIYVISSSSSGISLQHDADGTTDWNIDATNSYTTPETYKATNAILNIGKYTAYVTN